MYTFKSHQKTKLQSKQGQEKLHERVGKNCLSGVIKM